MLGVFSLSKQKRLRWERGKGEKSRVEWWKILSWISASFSCLPSLLLFFFASSPIWYTFECSHVHVVCSVVVAGRHGHNKKPAEGDWKDRDEKKHLISNISDSHHKICFLFFLLLLMLLVLKLGRCWCPSPLPLPCCLLHSYLFVSRFHVLHLFNGILNLESVKRVVNRIWLCCVWVTTKAVHCSSGGGGDVWRP